MIVDDKSIDKYIKKWRKSSRAELKNRLKSLQNKNTPDSLAEKKAIIALLA